MIFPVKVPEFVQNLFPSLIWKINTDEKTIYLTFDDGPIDEVTPFVLETLKIYHAKATFFCIGDNIRKHPKIYNQLISEGHLTANHSFNHLSGWKTSNKVYFNNIEKCESQIRNSKRLFRPPYGKIKPSQIKYLINDYKIIMWEVLSGDYQKNIDKEKRLIDCIHSTGKGSIVVFHDSIKAFENLQFVLPRFMEYFAERDYSFKSLII